MTSAMNPPAQANYPTYQPPHLPSSAGQRYNPTMAPYAPPTGRVTVPRSRGNSNPQGYQPTPQAGPTVLLPPPVGSLPPPPPAGYPIGAQGYAQPQQQRPRAGSYRPPVAIPPSGPPNRGSGPPYPISPRGQQQPGPRQSIDRSTARRGSSANTSQQSSKRVSFETPRRYDTRRSLDTCKSCGSGSSGRNSYTSRRDSFGYSYSDDEAYMRKQKQKKSARRNEGGSSKRKSRPTLGDTVATVLGNVKKAIVEPRDKV
ncbi:hypothetical protein K431DRAFT_294570 [Polychaeton citri CBS 116435]|uniref:Uncharacterized protein n=1 Tax=Polychaeton citri CBS 116435 TaxID=1314669 RepID=A0A9P4UPS4_9PEZI|nr:hypothetical protein K431DRAFT_294570 [Polychaeton citri CBS 116435]